MKNILRTDARVKIMDEILYGIHVIKMYAWEKSFAKIVGHIRRLVETQFNQMMNIYAKVPSTSGRK